jgi:hypothetical protein
MVDEEAAQTEGVYFEAIGRLVVEFARAEAFVHYLANWQSGLGTEKGMAIFAGMRLPDLIQAIRACMRLNKMESKASNDLDACFTQLDVIGKVRHKLAHRYVEIASEFGPQISVHTLYTAKSLVSADVEEFTLQDMAAMTEDCFCIRIRILRHTDAEARRKTRTLEERIFQPWRYKPPQSQPPSRYRHRVMVG